MLTLVSNNTLLFGMPGGTELIIIVVVILLLFGGKKNPEFMRGLGKGVKEFKDAKDEAKQQLDEGLEEPKKDSMVTARVAG